MIFLVTGGAGFIGSHLIDLLLQLGHTVFNIDNFDAFYESKIKERNISNHLTNSNYTFIKADINDNHYWEPLLKDVSIDVIIHLAAKAGVRPSIINPQEYQLVNVIGTVNILEFARKKNIKKVVLASSSSVYGNNPNVPWNVEDTQLEPISPYAASKIAAEKLGKVYSHLYDIYFIGLRFFTVYGPRQRPDLAIHKFFKQIYNQQPIVVYGDGSTSRDYTYIADIVTGIMGAIDKPRNNASLFEVYNLGNSDTIKLIDLIKEIEIASGKQAILKYEAEQPGDVKQTFANIAKSSQQLNYTPHTRIKEGLKQFNNWYKEYYNV